MEVDAQTATATRTPTVTPNGATFTPAPATSTPDGGRFLCPEDPVYSSDVGMSYLVQCGHCVTYTTPTPSSVQVGSLPQMGLPITSLFTRTPTPTGTIGPTITATVNPYLTQYPTVTPAFFWGTPGPTETFEFTTPTVTPTPVSAVIFGLQDGFNGGGVTVVTWDDYWDSPDGFQYDYYSETGTFERGSHSNLGLAIVFDDLTFVHEIEYTVYNMSLFGDFEYETTLRTHEPGGTDILWATGNGSIHVHTGPGGDNEFLSDYDGFTRTITVDREVYALLIDTGHYSGAIASGVSSLILDRLEYIDNSMTVPTPTPTLTPEFTATMTPAGYVDCRNPATGTETEQVVDAAGMQNGLVALYRTCFTLIDPSFQLDLTWLNPDWLIDPEPVEICIVAYRVPPIKLLGIELPLNMLLAVTIIAYFIRTLRVY